MVFCASWKNTQEISWTACCRPEINWIMSKEVTLAVLESVLCWVMWVVVFYTRQWHARSLHCVEDVCSLGDRVNLKPRLHDTTCCQTRCHTGCQTGLTTGCIVYTNIYPVVKRVWQPGKCLTNGCIVYTAGCQSGLTNTGWQPVGTNSGCSFKHGCQTVFVKPVVKPVWQPVWQPAVWCIQTFNRLSNRFDSRLTTGWMFVYMIQPVVRPVVLPVWQPVVSCKRGFTCSSTVAEWRVPATTATAPGSTGHVTWTICLCRRRVASRRPSDAPPRRQSMNLADSVNSTPFYSLSPATSLLSQRSRPGYRTPLTDQLVRYMAAVLAVLFIFPDSVFFSLSLLLFHYCSSAVLHMDQPNIQCWHLATVGASNCWLCAPHKILLSLLLLLLSRMK